jgi:hypothetical protein
MIVDRATYKEIESHFYNYQAERAWIEEQKAEIAETNTTPHLDKAWVKPTDKSDPTLNKVIEIEKNIKTAQAWVDVVAGTVKHFSGTPKAEFISMVYVEGQNPNDVCNKLFISEKTYYNCRHDILNYALLLAVDRKIYLVI